MREIRQSGSEGGEPQLNAAFLPLSFSNDPQRLNGNVNNGDCLLVDATSSLDSSSSSAKVDLVSASRSSM